MPFSMNPRTPQIEHAARDQIARVDAVMIVETEPLDFLEKGELQISADVLADDFAGIARRHLQPAAQDRRPQHQRRGEAQDAQGRAADCPALLQQRVHLVDREAEQAWHHQVEERRPNAGHGRQAKRRR